jgi:hypothetical protein
MIIAIARAGNGANCRVRGEHFAAARVQRSVRCGIERAS